MTRVRHVRLATPGSEPSLRRRIHPSGPWVARRGRDWLRFECENRVHWVEQRLVGQVAFTGWTACGQLRHPRFRGLRRDKDPSEVVRERPGP